MAADFKNNGRPIRINDARIDATSDAMAPRLRRAVVVAHESGHVFGLKHYHELAQYTDPKPDPISNLSLSQFAVDGPPLNQTHVRFLTWLDRGQIVTSDELDTEEYALAGNRQRYKDCPASVAAVLPSAVLGHCWMTPVLVETGLIGIWRAWGYIMDLSMRDPAIGDPSSPESWHFRPAVGEVTPPFSGDLNLMCVQCASVLERVVLP